MKLTRRSFVDVSQRPSPSLCRPRRARRSLSSGDDYTDEQLPCARQQLLSQVNAERAAAGLSELKLDDLACSVANEHARDMATNEFLSHWGSDGRKPFHRYGFAGGTAAVQENCSAASDIDSVSPTRVLDDLRDMHQSMLDEVPPHDGHRKTILDPYHTHVGFGVALNSRSLRLDELYLARYLQVDPVATEAKPGATIRVSGRLLNPNHFINEIDVYYEPMPQPPDISWLRDAALSLIP